MTRFSRAKAFLDSVREIDPPRRKIADLCFAIVAASCVWQLFVPPQIGLANNGDFSKVAGYYSLAPTVGWSVDEVDYFITDYAFSPKYRWHSGLVSSGHAFVWLAVKLNRLFISKKTFSIHILTAVHLCFYLLVCGALLRILSGLSLVAVGLAVFVLSDLSLVASLPTFYMDTPAMLFLLAAGTSVLGYVTTARKGLWAAGVIVFGLLLITSKSQHAFLGLPLAAFAIVEGVRVNGRRWRWYGAAALFLTAAGWMLSTPTAGYRAAALFSMTFYKMGLSSGDPARDFAELGLGPEYVKYKGLHAYSALAPVEDPQWQREFMSKTGSGKLAEFYLRHPLRAWSFVWGDLNEYGYLHPDPGLGFHKKRDGIVAAGIYPWRILRNALMKAFPAHVFILLAAGCLAWKRPGGNAVFMLNAMCALSLAVATLADCLATARHLFLFQLLCDLLICYWICWGVWRLRLARLLK